MITYNYYNNVTYYFLMVMLVVRKAEHSIFAPLCAKISTLWTDNRAQSVIDYKGSWKPVKYTTHDINDKNVSFSSAIPLADRLSKPLLLRSDYVIR